MTTPESSNIFQEFEDMSGTLLPIDKVEQLRQEGTPLFTEKDVGATSDIILSMFRRLCVQEHITKEYFDEKYKQYAILVLGKTPQSAMNNKANIVKELKKGEKLSSRRFMELTQLVLGLKPTLATFVFVTEDNQEIPITVRTEDGLMTGTSEGNNFKQVVIPDNSGIGTMKIGYQE